MQRLMRVMGLQGAVPGPHTSRPHLAHAVYPYLIGHMQLARANLVWATDINYVPMPVGSLYLVAIINRYSGYALAWQLSNTLDSGFCLDTLDAALADQQRCVFNTDQGAQFTSSEFTNRLKEQQILIYMDGRGRALDNAFIERRWRTVKYEDIYRRDYQSVPELDRGFTTYFRCYNHDRPHSSLGRETPVETRWASLPIVH